MTSAAKVLQFPLAGLAKDQDYRKAYIPSEGAAFATPLSVNVLGECALKERARGGSRPGLTAFTGVVTESDAKWLWPNGDGILWSGTETSHVTKDGDGEIVAPDGNLLFDPHETFTIHAAKGSVPSNCTVMAKYRARLVVAKDDMWYASRQGDMTDFDYGGDGDDIGRAVAGNVALAGRKGEDITAMASLEDKYLVVATARSVRVLGAEPTNGAWTIASEFTGIISRDAWCWDSTTFWFMGENGLYAMVPSEGIVKKASGRLPVDFKGWASATLIYDAERNGIHILGVVSGTTRSDWFYDIEQGALWPMEYPSAKQPTAGALCVIDGVNKVVFNCADGVWRYWDDDNTTDDGTAISSKVAIGPLRVSGRDDMDGLVAEVSATMAESSADVTCKIYTSRSPEGAVALAEADGVTRQLTFSAGWNHVDRPRKRGAWVIFVLSATGRWGYESMTTVGKMLGRLR